MHLRAIPSFMTSLSSTPFPNYPQFMDEAKKIQKHWIIQLVRGQTTLEPDFLSPT